ncbi:SGNH/GDSL hydrolase family protein, partial [Streptomyces ipomoeae]|uniref:GDSL-type esterase/lipase family protein n=1 Tax=Streptomyces ipomoeae TaxID=103232 RepID=UPI0029A910C5
MHAKRDLITTPITADLLRGALDLERTGHGVLPHRLPAWARAQYLDDQLAMAESQPSGVRLVFRTRATVVELDTLPTKRTYVGAPPRPDGIYDLVVDGRPAGQASVEGGNILTTDMTRGTADLRPGSPGTLRFTLPPTARETTPAPREPSASGREATASGEFGRETTASGALKTVEIWLPHNETTELRALRTDAPVEPAPATDRRVWLHHGSSISHGSDAASPTTTWPALAASLGGVELINLGLSGSAVLDPFTARALRDTPADLISVKIGINIVNHDVMRLRAFTPAVHGFLDTIREGHPTTPLLVVSPILCPIHEDTPGPSAPDFSDLAEGRLRFRAMGDPTETASGKLTLRVIREELSDLVSHRSRNDPHLYYLDGRALYGPSDTTLLPLPDDLHPDAPTHRVMAERFATLTFTAKGAFGAAQGGRRGTAPGWGSPRSSEAESGGTP